MRTIFITTALQVFFGAMFMPLWLNLTAAGAFAAFLLWLKGVEGKR